jgi:hypothetical protein
MGKKAETLASSAFAAGLFLGIYFYTGVSVEPLDLLGLVAQSMAGQLAPSYLPLVEITLFVFTVVGIWQTITMIASGRNFGILGLAMTISGFIGGALLIFSPIIGIVLTIICFVIGSCL